MVNMVKSFKKMDKPTSHPYFILDGSKKPFFKLKLEKWVTFTILIAIYGFLKNISPESPYMAEYFIGPKLNFTTVQVTQEIYPVSVYGSGIQTLIVLLITDLFRYKPIIVAGAVGFFLHKSLLVWGRTLLEMQVNQFLWGTSKACSLAYKTYIYSMVDREHYQRVTAVIRIAPKAGTLVSAAIAMVCLSGYKLKIEHLNIISFVASGLAVMCALTLPSLKKNVNINNNDKPIQSENSLVKTSTWVDRVKLLLQDVKDAIHNRYIIMLCIWWILATAGFQQVTDYYIQVLWSEITNHEENKFNAPVEGAYTVISGLTCYWVGGMKLNWGKYIEFALGFTTILKGLGLLYSAQTQSLGISYAIYIAFSTLFDLMMVIINSEVAKHLKNESFALIFGINSFLASILQCLLTYLVSSKHVLALPIRQQFLGIGYCFMALGVCYMLKAIVGAISCRTRNKIEGVMATQVKPTLTSVTVVAEKN